MRCSSWAVRLETAAIAEREDRDDGRDGPAVGSWRLSEDDAPQPYEPAVTCSSRLYDAKERDRLACGLVFALATLSEALLSQEPT